MNPDFENFRTSTWPELQKWIPWNMVVPKHRYRADPSWEAIRPFTIVFMNGAKMYCKGLKDPESARGANLNWFWYDEGRRDPTGLGWKNAIAFLRIGDMPQAWCTTTMAGLEHWTNTFFQGKNSEELTKIVEEVKSQGTDQELFSIFKTSTKDNSINLDPMFYASLVSAYPAGSSTENSSCRRGHGDKHCCPEQSHRQRYGAIRAIDQGGQQPLAASQL